MKTKEQILQQAFVGQEADIHLNIPSGYKFGHYPDSVQRTYIYASMQFFADQEKAALKENLTKKIESSKLSGLSKATVYALITQL